ncbi:DUF6796 family protein [Corynebacterium mendelii]|uniref:Beta-carotene 15,15'-monooxygenase n=1 Tax=Corynebacterium mendelii TaxID=2765362 RepID=A0A939DYI1_9CORY|nr:DUF6796 family protein [Corynebacterium mendelii]MBN9643155.1 hypothetical protein [Corynebacterium mendelii]
MFHLSALSLLVAAICWTIGDMLIVGFAKPDKKRFGGFIKTMGDDIYAYLLPGSEKRLRWGALIANYSIPLLLFGCWSHWLLMGNTTVGRIGVVLLAVGITLSPLAHAAYYPLAATAKLAWQDYRDGANETASMVTAREMFVFLKFSWFPAIALSFCGGLLITVSIAAGWTVFPQWMCVFTPTVLLVPCMLATRLPYPGKPLLDGAIFNLVLLVWAVALLIGGAVYGIR